MNTVWILVCDAAKGRFFEVRGHDPSWHIIEVLTHDESRSKSSDLASDRSGQRSSEGASVHHNALAPASSPKDVAKDHFIHTLAGRLDGAMRSRRFHGWLLVAPPHVVGMLKRELTSELEKHLRSVIGQDFNNLGMQALAARLRDDVRAALDQAASPREGSKHTH
jgi:protein required for attachment to host cells